MAFGPLFPQQMLFRGLELILCRRQTTRSPTQPKFSGNALITSANDIDHQRFSTVNESRCTVTNVSLWQETNRLGQHHNQLIQLNQKSALTFGSSDYGGWVLVQVIMMLIEQKHNPGSTGNWLLTAGHAQIDLPNGRNPLDHESWRRWRVAIVVPPVRDGGGSRTEFWRLVLPLQCLSHTVDFRFT